ncbi:hypothetical protein JI747_016300 [Chryseobacterium sp. RG1]|uniref:DNA-directed RNA polymerase n=1 Tax=Chryseobacterium tagetis TaxID=2801334 RepID=A0ABS8A711_9FLAO|nr:hypothetical protein [Chryseobacterium tagetis]MCA6068730.1 hypothetical protein [Chryseobacterium tagetis]
MNHNGSEIQQNPDSVTQVKGNRELPKKLSLYIPQNFDIDKLVKDNPPTFKYHRDYFIYLIHLITDIPIRNKDENMFYVPFYSSLIQRRVREYRKYLDYLVSNNVLIENRQYIVGSKSRGFRFHINYQTEIKHIYITKRPLIKSILKFIHLDKFDNNEIIIENNEELSYLLKWFNGKLDIDFASAKNYLQHLYEIEKRSHNIFTSDKPCNAMGRYNSRYMVLLKLKRQEFLHTIDSTAGRLHTILTQLKGDLRQFVTYDGKPLVAVDITNSQPYLSTVLFNEEKFKENNILSTVKLYNKSYHSNNNKQNFLPYYVSKNVKNAYKSESTNHYIDIVKSGQLYEEFGKILLSKGIITDEEPVRTQAKTIIFSSIFSPNQSIAYNQSMVIFKDSFPDVYEIYRQIKQGQHRTLACLLQNVEAKLVLHTACKIIAENEPEIPIFTLHDSIITTSGNEQYVFKVLYDVLLNGIGIPPTLKFERWEKVA